jgi:hypothetical protein
LPAFQASDNDLPGDKTRYRIRAAKEEVALFYKEIRTS